MAMYRWLCLTVVLLLNSNALAQWEVLSGELGNVYVDPSSLMRKQRNIVTVRILRDYPEGSHIYTSAGWAKSEVLRMEYDCARQRYRFREGWYYSEQLGTGELLDTQGGFDQWSDLSHPANQTLWRYACTKGIAL